MYLPFSLSLSDDFARTSLIAYSLQVIRPLHHVYTIFGHAGYITKFIFGYLDYLIHNPASAEITAGSWVM